MILSKDFQLLFNLSFIILFLHFSVPDHIHRVILSLPELVDSVALSFDKRSMSRLYSLVKRAENFAIQISHHINTLVQHPLLLLINPLFDLVMIYLVKGDSIIRGATFVDQIRQRLLILRLHLTIIFYEPGLRLPEIRALNFLIRKVILLFLLHI